LYWQNSKIGSADQLLQYSAVENNVRNPFPLT
jgi:hypothetical protein